MVHKWLQLAISKYHKLTGASKLNVAIFLSNAMSLPSFFLNFSGVCVCVCVCVCIPYITEVIFGMEDVQNRNEEHVPSLHQEQRVLPFLCRSRWQQVAPSRGIWGKEGSFPKLVLMLLRVPVWRLNTQVPKVISKRPMRKGINFLIPMFPAPHGPFGLWVTRLQYILVMLLF